MSIFSFFNKNKEKSDANISFYEEEVDQHQYILTGTPRNFSALKTNDIVLKIWLPESIKVALNEMTSYTDTSNSDFIRQTLFTYLYGRYDLMASIEKGEHDFALNGSIKFSKQASPPNDEVKNRTPELGKNTYDIKVWISTKMKDDIQALADKSELKLSHFIREVLISNFFGHSYLSERNELINFRIEFGKD